uniref:Uncharacterized protein n=1 Tax=Anopheles funestus TaxID=62324 RepID=A0A182RXX0_ANOFN
KWSGTKTCQSDLGPFRKEWEEENQPGPSSSASGSDSVLEVPAGRLSNKITHTALSDLLVLIRETTNISLPRCSKTLLKTGTSGKGHSDCWRRADVVSRNTKLSSTLFSVIINIL